MRRVDLASGEHALFEGHPSWRSILGYYIKGLAVAAAIGALAALASRIAEDEVKTGWVAIAAGAVLGFVIVVGYVRRLSTTYTITNRRLHIKRGIVARRTQEARLERVQNVNTDQSVLERMLQVGTVDFDTAGGDDHDFKFAGVGEPGEVVQAVDRAQREAAAEPEPEPGV
jgi:uncharacterized membrane protein YdbT with pleckstrin-like domain